jgi:2,3-bisphosphoglycerate-independent phosphoglycerate mutase
VSDKRADATIKNGKLGDLAPTFLYLMGVEKPADMTGDVLIG